jgi:hypothetical protein
MRLIVLKIIPLNFGESKIPSKIATTKSEKYPLPPHELFQTF